MSKEKFLNLVSLSNSSPSPFVGTKKYISTGDVDVDTIKLETAIDITFDDRPSRANVECKPGDVLFAKMAETNKSLLIDDINSNYIFSTGFSCITPKANKLTSKCLFYLVSSPQFLTQKNKYSSGSTQRAINNEGLSKIFVDIPDLSEQQSDIEILDKVNSLLKKTNKCIDLCNSLVKSKFINTFGDPSSLFNTANSILADTGKIITGKTPSTTHEEYYDSADIPFVKPGDIEATSVIRIEKTEQYLSENARKACRLFPSDSVLYVCIGATIGKVGISSCECTCNQQINAIIPNKNVDPIYLAYYLHYIKNQVVSIANAPVVPIINKSNFSHIPVFIPDLAKQKEFASFANQVNQLKNKLILLVDKINILYKSLLQKYFG